MGLFDDILSGPFDLNSDGDLDACEEWIEYNVFNECMNDDEDDDNEFDW